MRRPAVPRRRRSRRRRSLRRRCCSRCRSRRCFRSHCRSRCRCRSRRHFHFHFHFHFHIHFHFQSRRRSTSPPRWARTWTPSSSRRERARRARYFRGRRKNALGPPFPSTLAPRGKCFFPQNRGLRAQCRIVRRRGARARPWVARDSRRRPLGRTESPAHAGAATNGDGPQSAIRPRTLLLVEQQRIALLPPPQEHMRPPGFRPPCISFAREAARLASRRSLVTIASLAAVAFTPGCSRPTAQVKPIEPVAATTPAGSDGAPSAPTEATHESALARSGSRWPTGAPRR